MTFVRNVFKRKHYSRRALSLIIYCSSSPVSVFIFWKNNKCTRPPLLFYWFFFSFPSALRWRGLPSLSMSTTHASAENGGTHSVVMLSWLCMSGIFVHTPMHETLLIVPNSPLYFEAFHNSTKLSAKWDWNGLYLFPLSAKRWYSFLHRWLV